jgi:hypothetical protein
MFELLIEVHPQIMNTLAEDHKPERLTVLSTR